MNPKEEKNLNHLQIAEGGSWKGLFEDPKQGNHRTSSNWSFDQSNKTQNAILNLGYTTPRWYVWAPLTTHE